MGYALAGLAIAAVGAGASAYGTSQNAAAVGDMAMFNIALSDKFGKRWTGNAEDLIDEKKDILYNSGDIFQRFESTGAFGSDLGVLDDLRKAQSDFAKLGAGDFSGFESQLDRIMKDNLNATFGAGAPIGSYTDLSADAIMNLRQQGLGQAQQTTAFLNDLTTSLMGQEFGIMDQGFNLKYQIDKDRTNAIMGYGMQGAQTEGVGMQAAGGALSSIGSSLFSYGMMQNNQQTTNPIRAADPYSTPVNGYYQPVPYGGYGGGAAVPSIAQTAPVNNPYSVRPPSYNANTPLPTAYNDGAWGDGSGGNSVLPGRPDVHNLTVEQLSSNNVIGGPSLLYPIAPIDSSFGDGMYSRGWGPTTVGYGFNALGSPAMTIVGR